MQNTMDHWEKHFEALESRLSASITENVTANVNRNLNTTILGLDTTLKTAMETMTTAVNGLIESNKTMIQHKVVMDDLTQQNQALLVCINRLEMEHLKLRDKFSQFESKELEHCILMHGIKEDEDEDESYLREQAYYELSFTIDHYDENERWRQIKQMEIIRCKQIDRYNRNRPRTLSIEFQHRLDVEYILANKKYLRRGIFVDKSYTAEVEARRKLLRPILKAAKKIPEYERRNKLEDDILVLQGKRYRVDTLNKLPKELNVFNLMTKSNPDTIGFFGELNPLSNFHPASFYVNGTHYTSSEQFIQHTKAILFKDYSTARKILNASSALECKELAKDIDKYSKELWEKEAKKCCKIGIKEKFAQNSGLKDVLIYCTENKQIVESANDQFWGTGVPLHQSDCLNPQQWISQGIMGEILMEIYHELIEDNKANVASANQDTVTIPPVPDTPPLQHHRNNLRHLQHASTYIRFDGMVGKP